MERRSELDKVRYEREAAERTGRRWGAAGGVRCLGVFGGGTAPAHSGDLEVAFLARAYANCRFAASRADGGSVMFGIDHGPTAPPCGCVASAPRQRLRCPSSTVDRSWAISKRLGSAFIRVPVLLQDCRSVPGTMIATRMRPAHSGDLGAASPRRRPEAALSARLIFRRSRMVETTLMTMDGP